MIVIYKTYQPVPSKRINMYLCESDAYGVESTFQSPKGEEVLPSGPVIIQVLK